MPDGVNDADEFKKASPRTEAPAYGMSGHACDADGLAENVTSAEHRAMTPAERKARQRQREAAQRERLLYTSDEWRAFVDVGGLQRKAGASWALMPATVLRELADNAADAANGAGVGIEIVNIDGTEWWCVGDNGRGIPPNEVTRTFSVNRPMQSTKHVRWPTRGMLGNGTRVVAGYCAIEGHQIMVDSHGTRTVLHVDKVTGDTVLERKEPIATEAGTRVYLERAAGLAEDGVDTLARNTLALAVPGEDASSYSGRSCPWWYGPADLRALMATAPARTTVDGVEIPGATMRNVVHDMGMKMPQGMPDGPAREVTEEQAAALLAALRENHPSVAQRIGRIGKNAFSDCYPGYAIESVIRKERSGAMIPTVIEAWAVCNGWKQRDHAVTAHVTTYLNRSAVAHGLYASGDREAVHLQGAGLRWRRVEVKPGRYEVIVSIITPHADLISDGKQPDLANVSGEIAAAIRQAMKLARHGVPHDDETPEERERREAEEKAKRRAKDLKEHRREQNRRQREEDQARWRAIGGERVLLRTIEAEAAAAGLTVDDLTVGDKRSSPFRMDTPPNHRIGRWLKDHMPEGRQIHLRGLHYLLVSTSGLVRPDGKPYKNDKACWEWLGKKLSAARWLGYVGFDQIEDERNAEPIWAPASDRATAPRIAVDDPTLPYLPDLSELVPEMSLAWDGKADRQQYHLCLFGEKTGLRSILAPLADEFGADLLLPSGEPSATMMDRLVKRTIADGRPLVVLTFTDLDPTGQGIPASVADRLRAMLLLVGAGNIHVQVVPAALTVEQARAYDLPDAPLKKTEARAIRWQAATGRGQTEIDALATLQPEVLVQIARDAIKPFYDADLARRAREARETWEHQARQLLDAALDQMPAYRAAMQQLEQHHDDYAEVHAAMDAAISELRAAKDQAREQTKLPELPECQATGVPVAAALYDSNDSFVANTMRLREAKLLDVAEKDEDGEDEEGDDDGGEACLSR